MAEICVIGAGPAGCVFAARMAALGHDVRLLEQTRFPRSRLGESLTPGVAPLLKSAGLGGALEGPHARRAPQVRVRWDGPERLRELGEGAGWIVERGGFDAALLARARSLGVQVSVPARARAFAREKGRWRVEIERQGRRETVAADFLADARGRSGKPQRQGVRTIALHAYTRARRPDAPPRIAALANGWAWGVPLPGGLYNLIVFLDAASRTGREPLARALVRHAEAAGLFEDAHEAIGDVAGIEATPHLDGQAVGADWIRLGDRALALDPLSSSGVQKAVQGALSAAIVANTLLRRPERAEAAMRFHRTQLDRAFERHAAWAGGHYAAAGRDGAFWSSRARAEPTEIAPHAVSADFLSEVPIRLSAQAEWRETPCLARDYVALAPALAHPRLDDPVAFLGGAPLAPLLRDDPGGRTALDMARGWAPRLPLETGLSIAAWLAARGVLEPCLSRAPA